MHIRGIRLLQYYVDGEICPNNADTFRLHKRIDCQNWIMALDIELYAFFPPVTDCGAQDPYSRGVPVEILASRTSRYLSSRNEKLERKNKSSFSFGRKLEHNSAEKFSKWRK